MLKKIVVLCLLFSQAAVSAAAFTDIGGSKGEKEINALAEAGIVAGISDTEFSPQGLVTRAEFAAMAARAFSAEAVPYSGQFSDVQAGDWFADDVAAAAGLGLIDGYDGLFRPNDNVSNEEACKILVCAFERRAEPIVGALAYNTFLSDYFDVSPWAREYVGKAEMIGCLQYTSGNKINTMSPKAPCTRENAAVALYNTINAVQVYRDTVYMEEDAQW